MKLRRGLNLNIKKAYTEGIYTDNSLNRKLGRVGMKYGINIENFEKEEDSESNTTYSPKLILKRMQYNLSDRSFKFLKDIIQDESFEEGDLYEEKGKVYIQNSIEIDPIRDKDIINLGNREEDAKKEEQKSNYYSLLEKFYSKEALEASLFFTHQKDGSKKLSLLGVLTIDNDQINYMLDSAKREIYYNGLKEGKYSVDSSYGDISDIEAERYIKKRSKEEREKFQYYSSSRKLIQILKKYNINLDGETLKTIEDNSEELVKNFRNFIENSSRQDFYDAYKDLITNKNTFANSLLRGRMMFKYNKFLAGDGWDIKTDDGKIDFSKRDDLISLCNQIEYAIDDVLGENKNLFINNPNIKFLNYSKATNWGGASYSSSTKTITITDEYFTSVKLYNQSSKEASTLSREKFLVEGFIHEIGHSTDLTSDIYNSEAYKDFAEHLGYEKNKKYTIYANAIEKDADKFIDADNNLSIKKDKKDKINDRFSDLFKESQEKEIVQEIWGNEQISKIFISNYSNKSACEGYAEYFSFYMGNKNKIDKDIENYKKDPENFVKNKDIKDWYRYSIYNQKWKEWVDGYDSNKGSKEERNKYYQEVIKYNMEMLIDMQKIVNQLKKKYK